MPIRVLERGVLPPQPSLPNFHLLGGRLRVFNQGEDRKVRGAHLHRNFDLSTAAQNRKFYIFTCTVAAVRCKKVLSVDLRDDVSDPEPRGRGRTLGFDAA